jgi:hypothetical protein
MLKSSRRLQTELIPCNEMRRCKTTGTRLSVTFMHPSHKTPSFMTQTATLLHLQLVSKIQFCPKNLQRITLTFGRVIKTLPRPGEVAFLKEGQPLKNMSWVTVLIHTENRRAQNTNFLLVCHCLNFCVPLSWRWRQSICNDFELDVQ